MIYLLRSKNNKLVKIGIGWMLGRLIAVLFVSIIAYLKISWKYLALIIGILYILLFVSVIQQDVFASLYGSEYKIDFKQIILTNKKILTSSVMVICFMITFYISD